MPQRGKKQAFRSNTEEKIESLTSLILATEKEKKQTNQRTENTNRISSSNPVKGNRLAREKTRSTRRF